MKFVVVPLSTGLPRRKGIYIHVCLHIHMVLVEEQVEVGSHRSATGPGISSQSRCVSVMLVPGVLRKSGHLVVTVDVLLCSLYTDVEQARTVAPAGRTARVCTNVVVYIPAIDSKVALTELDDDLLKY